MRFFYQYLRQRVSNFRILGDFGSLLGIYTTIGIYPGYVTITIFTLMLLVGIVAPAYARVVLLLLFIYPFAQRLFRFLYRNKYTEEKMKIFVTGATGFIGGRLAQKLAARGDTVVCLARDPSKVKTNAALPNLQWVRGDVTEPASMKEAMRGSDAVFHVAGLYKFGPKYFPQMRAINVDGTRNVLQMAAELGVSKIIHTSTVGVFGNTRHKIVDETYRCGEEEMESEYEKTKWEAHYQVAVPLQEKGAPVIIVQPGLVTGPNDPSPHALTYDFYFNRFPLGFGATAGSCWGHVDDTADGHIAAMERGKFEAYCISGEPLTWKQVLEMWAPLTGIPAPKLWAPDWMMRANQALLGAFERVGIHLPLSAESLGALTNYTFWATNEKAQRELDWHPRSTLQLMRDLMDFEMTKRGIKSASKTSRVLIS